MHPQEREEITSPPSIARNSIVESLRDDHLRLERWFQSIVSDAACGDQDNLRQSWCAFEGELSGHLDAEELHIFPLFTKDYPDEARALLGEHLQIRSKLLALGIDLDLHCLNADRIETFVAELRAHAHREDQLLYTWANQHLGDASSQQIRDTLTAAKDKARIASRQSEWRIGGDRSPFHFSLRHIVVHEIAGQFSRWGGTLWLDNADWTRSKVIAWIDLGSIETGDQERDAHVKSPEFFDIGRFPKARFVSREVQMRDPRTALVRGQLRLHGRVGDVDLLVVAVEDKAPSDNHRVFDVTGSINRQQFGLRWNQDLDKAGIVLGNQVTLHARVELKRLK